MPVALTLSRAAAQTLTRSLKSAEMAQRLVLSLFFRAVLGIPRVFHFETLHDVGFAVLTGGRRVLSRTRLGGLIRAVSTRAAKAFSHATTRWSLLKGQVVSLSLDEHAIARFTRKYRIPKGYHTVRNKHMRIEKVSFLYWPAQRQSLCLLVTKGTAKLASLAQTVLQMVRRLARPAQLRLILDAAAAHDHAALCAFDRHHNVVFLIRAPRRPAYVKAWKQLPRDAFLVVDEPGRYAGAKPKRIEVTETTTVIKGMANPVRTLVVREHAKRGKDRWHALFIVHDDTTAPLDLVHEFRTRQHHEQSHRIGVHDLMLDTTPSGYPKKGLPDRPGFRQGPLHLCSWVVALVSHAMLSLGASLPARFHRAHPRTLRRWVLLRDAELYLTPSHLLVVLESARGRLWLRPLLQQLNEANVTLPWLDHRRIAIGLAPTARPVPDAKPVFALSEVSFDSKKAPRSVWC